MSAADGNQAGLGGGVVRRVVRGIQKTIQGEEGQAICSHPGIQVQRGEQLQASTVHLLLHILSRAEAYPAERAEDFSASCRNQLLQICLPNFNVSCPLQFRHP